MWLGIEFSTSVQMVVSIALLTADFSCQVSNMKTSLAVCSTSLVLNRYGSLHSRKVFVSEFKCAVKHICN